jgi:hypothetical protein
MADASSDFALDPGLQALSERLPGSFTKAQLSDFRSRHSCSALSMEVEGSRVKIPCAFPGCRRGTNTDEILAGGRQRLRRSLRWFGGPHFEWKRI